MALAAASGERYSDCLPFENKGFEGSVQTGGYSCGCHWKASKFFTKITLKKARLSLMWVSTGMKNNKICGDVDFEDVAGHVSAITPVPGGVE